MLCSMKMINIVKLNLMTGIKLYKFMIPIEYTLVGGMS